MWENYSNSRIQIWSALETVPGRLQSKRIIGACISLEVFNFFCHRVQKHHQDQTVQIVHFLREFSGWCFTCFHRFSNCESTESMGFHRVGSCEGQILSHQTSNSPFLCLMIRVFSFSHLPSSMFLPVSAPNFSCITEELHYSSCIVGVGQGLLIIPVQQKEARTIPGKLRYISLLLRCHFLSLTKWLDFCKYPSTFLQLSFLPSSAHALIHFMFF